MRNLGYRIAWLGWALAAAAVVQAGDTKEELGPEFWVGRLKRDDVPSRQQAVYALYKLGKESRPHVRAIARCLRDPDEYVRTTAKSVLAQWSFQKGVIDGLTPAVPELIEALADERSEVRLAAINLLWLAGPIPNVQGGPAPTEAHVFALALALSDGDAQVRANAAACLLNVAPRAKAALPKLAKALEDDDAIVRLWAMRAAAGIDPEWLVPRAVDRVKDPDPSVRVAAAAALAAAPAPIAEAVRGALRSLVDDSDPQCCIAAVDATCQLNDPWARKFLEEVLASDRTTLVRSQAAIALGGIGDPRSLPVLLEALRETHASVIGGAIEGIGGMGPEGGAHVARLLPFLQHREPPVRARAVAALSNLAPWAAEAVHGLTVLLECDDIGSMRAAAASALHALAVAGHRDPRMLDAAIAVLERGDAEACPQAIQVVSAFGASAGKAVPALQRLCEPSSTWKDPNAVCWTAACIGPPAAALAPHLESIMKSASEHRLIAALARARVRPADAGPAIQTLIDAAEGDPDGLAFYYLSRLGAAAEPARPALRRGLAAGGSSCVHAATAFLILGGADRATAIRWFEEQLKDARRPTPISVLAEVGPEACPLVPALLAIATQMQHPRRRLAIHGIRMSGAESDAVRAAMARARSDADASIRTEAALWLAAHERGK